MDLFNSGVCIVTPNAGDLPTNPTPLALGILQEMQSDVSQEIKELYGQNIFPADVATGKGKIALKGKFASFTGKVLSDIVTGAGATVGYNSPVYNEGPTAIPTTPFQITVTHSADFVADLGVINAATGDPMTKVGSGPTAGQYSVAAGVYTFSSADNVSGISVKISYIYSVSSTGYKVVVPNNLMGYGPIFEIDQFIQYKANVALLRFYAARLTKWSFPAKQGEFLIQDVEFSCFANSAGNVYEIDANV